MIKKISILSALFLCLTALFTLNVFANERLPKISLDVKVSGQSTELSWDYDDSFQEDFVGFQIDKKVDNENWQFVVMVSGNASSATDTLPNGYKKVSYRIKGMTKNLATEYVTISINNPAIPIAVEKEQTSKIDESLAAPVLTLSDNSYEYKKSVVVTADENLPNNKNKYEWSNDSFVTTIDETSNTLEITSSKDMGDWYCRLVTADGKVSVGRSITIEKIDDTIPTTPMVKITTESSEPYNIATYAAGKVSITIEGSEALSGIDYYEYSTDNGANWKKYNDKGSLSLSTNAKISFTARAVSKVEIVGSPTAPIDILIDNTPPTSPVFILSSQNDESDVIIIEPGTDNEAGVSKTEYKVTTTDTKNEWQIYNNNPITVKKDEKLYARTYNNAGMFTVANYSSNDTASPTITLPKPEPEVSSTSQESTELEITEQPVADKTSWLSKVVLWFKSLFSKK